MKHDWMESFTRMGFLPFSINERGDYVSEKGLEDGHVVATLDEYGLHLTFEPTFGDQKSLGFWPSVLEDHTPVVSDASQQDALQFLQTWVKAHRISAL